VEALRRENSLKGSKGREWIWDRTKNQFKIDGFISA
jgi:hypothetical protein